MMDLSLRTLRDVSKKDATDYTKLSKTAKGLILDELVDVAGVVPGQRPAGAGGENGREPGMIQALAAIPRS